MLSGHLKSDFISRNISHRLPPVWKYFTKIIPCHQKYVSWLAGCGVLNNVKWNKFRGYKVSPGCQFTISHASLAPGLDLDWVVVILCNNFPAQPQIWPQWTHYPLIHNFHPLLPSPLPAPGPASTGSDANLGCLGFMNIWKLRLGWSLIGTKTLSFNLLSLSTDSGNIVHLENCSPHWNRRGRGRSLSTDRNLRWESCDHRLGSGSHTFWYLEELQYFKCLSEL